MLLWIAGAIAFIAFAVVGVGLWRSRRSNRDDEARYHEARYDAETGVRWWDVPR